jgi:hypothetical protein
MLISYFEMDLESRFSEAEEKIQEKKIEDGVKVLLQITDNADINSEIYEKSIGFLLGIHKHDLQKVDSKFLTKNLIKKLFDPFLNNLIQQNHFPFFTASITDLRNPSGMKEYLETKNKLGWYNYQLATLRERKWGLSCLDQANYNFKLLRQGIEQYKHRIDEPFDVTLCCTYNNLGNTAVERARFFSNCSESDKLFSELERFGLKASRDSDINQVLIAVCLDIVYEAKNYYLNCFEDNVSYNNNNSLKEKDKLKTIRSDAKENLEYIQKLINDPYRFVDSNF